MQSDQSVAQSARCRRKRQSKAAYSCLRPVQGVSTGGSSKRLFCFLRDPQSGLANGPMLGPHSHTDGIVVATPMPVTFRSDHENEQRFLMVRLAHDNGCSIEGIRRSACNSPLGWLEVLGRSRALGSRYAWDKTTPSVYDPRIQAKEGHHE
jgi:hypothetical protein